MKPLGVYVGTLVVGLGLLVATLNVAMSPVPSDPVEAAANSIVRISDESGHGSGVVIRADGLILTNRHVVEGVTGNMVVTLRNGNTLPAEVLWVSGKQYDLALIRVGIPLTPVTLRMEPLKLGEEVFAVGHPGNYDWSVVFGHVANLGGRTINGVPGLVQIDADINVGNSGGGLFDKSGRLVGLPNSIAFIPMNWMMPPVSTDISFAVPISAVCKLTLACL